MPRSWSILLALVAAGCGGGRKAEGPATPPLSASHCDYVSMGAPEADVAQVREALEATAPAVQDYFEDLGGRALLGGVTCNVVVWGAAGPKAAQGRSMIETTAGDHVVATIHHLAPSAHSPRGRTGLGEPFDDAYLRRTLAHEYATIFLEGATARRSGWQYHSAPRWFEQGYEHYLGATLSAVPPSPVLAAKYLARTCADPSRVSQGFENVADAYGDGTVLVGFLHEEFGAARVRAILSNKEPTFWAALPSALGVGVEDLRARWDSWRSRRCGPQASANGGR